MLAEHQHIYADAKSIGDLFFAAFDELQDISFQHALMLIVSALFDAINDVLTLAAAEQEKLIDAFISAIPPVLAHSLKFST